MVDRKSWAPVFSFVIFLFLIAGTAFAVNVKPRPLASNKTKSKKVSESQHARKSMRRLAKSRAPRTRVARRRRHR
jgi:hypothetical protein